MDALQFGIVVNIGDIERSPGLGHETRNALRPNRQLDIFGGVKTGLDARHNRRAIVVHCVQREPIRIQQRTNIRTDIQHQMGQIFGVVDAGCHLLQALVEQCLKRTRRRDRGCRHHRFDAIGHTVNSSTVATCWVQCMAAYLD